LLRQGTIVDATIIAAPSSTKNKQKSRDPEMHQTKKGNQWYFGMKAHIGADVVSGIVHSLTGTAANEADINQMASVLHGEEKMVFADAGYTGAQTRPEHEDRGVSWNIAAKRNTIKVLPSDAREEAEAVERVLAQLRAPVEHPFDVVKNLFRHRKVRMCNRRWHSMRVPIQISRRTPALSDRFIQTRSLTGTPTMIFRPA
jgi:transposase, IS5 family